MFLYAALCLTIIYYLILLRLEQKYKAASAKELEETKEAKQKAAINEGTILQEEIGNEKGPDKEEELPVFGTSETYSFEHFNPYEKGRKLKKGNLNEAQVSMDASEHTNSLQLRRPINAMEESTDLLGSYLLEQSKQENQNKQERTDDQTSSLKIKL